MRAVCVFSGGVVRSAVSLLLFMQHLLLVTPVALVYPNMPRLYAQAAPIQNGRGLAGLGFGACEALILSSLKLKIRIFAHKPACQRHLPRS